MQRFKKILFIADGGASQGLAFKRALRLAEVNGAKLMVMDVVDDTASLPQHPFLIESIQTHQDTMLGKSRQGIEQLIAQQVQDHPDVSVDMDVRAGRLFIEVIDAVIKNGYDLVMKAANGGVGRIQMVFGSADLKLLRKCPCPVWVFKHSEEPHFARILAAVDPDPTNPSSASLNKLILDLATSLAREEKSKLDIVHAWEIPNEAALKTGQIPKARLDQMFEEIQQTHEREINELLAPYSAIEKNVHVIKGHAGDVIAHMAINNNVDLIVMGTIGRSGIPGFIIGNTAEKVIGSIDCSVLAVKPEGFNTPVQV